MFVQPPFSRLSVCLSAQVSISATPLPRASHLPRWPPPRRPSTPRARGTTRRRTPAAFRTSARWSRPRRSSSATPSSPPGSTCWSGMRAVRRPRRRTLTCGMRSGSRTPSSIPPPARRCSCPDGCRPSCHSTGQSAVLAAASPQGQPGGSGLLQTHRARGRASGRPATASRARASRRFHLDSTAVHH